MADMRAVVKQLFVDKNDNMRMFQPGTVLDWDDEARLKDCASRGLVEIIDEEQPEIKKTTKKKKGA